MTDDELDEWLNRSHQTGIAEGLRRAAEHIMQAAKDSFERFGTEERQTACLRQLANELHVMANTAHPPTPNAHALAEERSDDSQQRVVGGLNQEGRR
jgi:hypothetical protein